MGKHDGHTITYVETGTCTYKITEINVEKSEVRFDLSSQQLDDTTDRWLHCEDCDERLLPDEVGLTADYWLGTSNAVDLHSL